MGLMIHSLGELPSTVERGYYIYLLDYGWHEPLADTVFHNFDKMADKASRSNAVVLRGVVGCHFENQVLSWHHLNGQPSEDLLPAILVTTRHPDEFRNYLFPDTECNEWEDRLLIIPLRSACNTSSDVVKMIEQLFKDIEEENSLGDFAIAKEMKKGSNGAIVDALVLQPNFAGVGLDLKKMGKFFKGLRK